MIVLRTLEGAWKCALRCFLRLDERLVLIFVISAVLDGVVSLSRVAVVVVGSSSIRDVDLHRN